MMTSLLLAFGVVVFALWWLQWRWSQRHIEKMAARMHGPPRWPLVGNAFELGITTVDFYKNIHRLCTKYKPLFTIWLGPFLHTIVMDPKDVEILLSSSKYINKGYVYKFLHPWLGRGLLTSAGEKWHKHRKLITPTFHFKILGHFLQPITEKAVILIKSLEKEINGPSFDIYSYITLYSLDTITETAMSLNINAQSDKESPYVNAVNSISKITMERAIHPWYYSDIIFNLFPVSKQQKEALEILHGTTRMVIQKREKELLMKQEDSNISSENTIGAKKRLAFLDLLLQENMNRGTLSKSDIQEEVDTFMFEGHDTSASGLAFTLWLLSRHQNIQEKVWAEINPLLSDSTGDISIQVLSEMKYLECVIKESMRLYPPVPLFSRQVPEDATITGGIVLPANSFIVVPVTAIHRNPDIYPNPDQFIPERFLLEEKDTRNSFAYLPFSAGSRNCIGQKFAMLSMKATISKILSHYNLLPDMEFEPILSSELILKSVNGLNVKITKRR